jgi:hypothetical protein
MPPWLARGASAPRTIRRRYLCLPGEYVEDVTLKKHVAVWGFDRLGDFSTLLRGMVTCDLTLEGGIREKTFATWAGVSIFVRDGAPAGILFTGTNAQKLILHDVASRERARRSSWRTALLSEPARAKCC